MKTMYPNTTTARCSLSECHKYDTSHKRQRKDITLAVCDHLETFQPERWKARENWSYKAKRPAEANKANAVFNRQLKQWDRACQKGDLKAIMRLATLNPKLLA
jgi:hypothetical protein